MKYGRLLLVLFMCLVLTGFGNERTAVKQDRNTLPCDAEPVIMTTSDGIEFVRTPDSCFESLLEWPYEPRYVEIDGMRQAYVDEGPTTGPVVLLLHGQPSWSYLYRKMITIMANEGFRVIAMDHLGMGRSDKPIDIKSYSYLGHFDRLERFIRALDLSDINLFVQDWGSLLGLRVAGLNPSWFARIAVGNGILPVIPAGFQPFPPVENPDKAEEIKAPFNSLPAQQFPFYDGCNLLIPRKDNSYFGRWMTYAMKAESFHPAEVLEAMTWFELPADVEAAYDAPFPKRIYMAGVRVFPSLVNELPGMNEKAWSGLTSFERPFLALWASNDPGVQGSCEAQQYLVDNIPGAAGQPHDRLAEASHFLQEDQGEEIARRLVEFYSIGSDNQSTSYTAEKSSPLAGHWLSAETADEKKQRLQAIDEATDGLGRFMRGRARDRLFERTTPPKNLVIEIEGSKVTIVSGDGRLELEAGGAPIEVSGSDGKAQISAKIKGPQLIVAAITSKAERTIIYNTKEQNLLVEVTMKVAELSKPLKYVSTYSRVE